MTKILHKNRCTIFLTLVTCMFLTACEIEVSDNDKLDGNWQLRQVDTLATGTIGDKTYSGIYWGVENKLLQVRSIGNGTDCQGQTIRSARLLLRFEDTGKEFITHSPHLIVTKDTLQPIDNDSLLRIYGIANQRDTFVYECVDHKRLVLRNTLYRLHFRKY